MYENNGVKQMRKWENEGMHYPGSHSIT